MANFRILRILITCAAILWSGNSFAAISVETEPGNFDNISVIKLDKIADIISDAIKSETNFSKISLNIKAYPDGVKLNSKHDSYELSITDSNVNTKSRRFKYSIEFKNGSDVETIVFSGNYDEIVEAPVLSTKLLRSAIISENNIKVIEIEKSKLPEGAILDSDELLGKTLKHAIGEGKAVRKTDFEVKTLVTRNHEVKILYKTPNISLQAKGMAMENGSKGDFIRVRNSSSNKIIKAEIIDEDTVIVSPPNL